MEESGKFKTALVAIAFGLFAFTALGLIWFFFFGPASPVGFGWYLFSFAAGLTMIVLPCTLPLAFVIVPLSMGKGAAKGFGIAVAFGLGVALTLSAYGVIAAIVGQVAIGSIGAPLETVKNWLYFIAGLLAYLFAIGEIGLWKFRMPSYTGAAPAGIQKRRDFLKAFLLGLFLGNIGVGCPHPATPVILTRIAASGDVFYGWSLFFVHAIGRILPLLLLALLAILGVNALQWLIKRKDKIEHATGWGMVFVAAFILALGLFSHDWWVYSGQHTLLEEITQEERVLGAIVKRFNLGPPPHTHGPEELVGKAGLLGLPLALGNWVLVGLWALPMWWYYFRKKSQIPSTKSQTNSKFQIPNSKPEGEKNVEAAVQPYRFWLFAALTAFLVVTFIYYLPLRVQHQAVEHMAEEMPMGAMMEEHADEAHVAFYHEETEVREGLAVNLNVTPVPVLAGTSTRLDFFVNEKPGNVPVPASALQIEHTKLMHVIGVRSDMDEFFHIHPQPATTPGILSVDRTFGKPGAYKVWSEIKKDGINHAFGHPEFLVLGDGPRSEKQVSFGRNVIVGDYQVALELDEPVAKGHPHELIFDIHTLTGDEVAVEPYLAADMHLTLIRDDWKQFIHTHPVGGEHQGLRIIPVARANGRDIPGAVHDQAGADEVVRFAVTFPESGLYKAFAQFRPQGIDLPPDQALLAEFWVEVKEAPPLAFLDWWTKLLISLVFIVIASWVTHNYLTGGSRKEISAAHE